MVSRWVQIYYTDILCRALVGDHPEKNPWSIQGCHRDVKVVLNKIDFTERGQVANIINSLRSMEITSRVWDCVTSS